MWTKVIPFLAAAWMLQAYLTYRQVEAYRRTVRDMARRPGGFLGVGVHRRRLGRGAVVVLVTDPAGVICDGRLMSGITVFSRLQPYSEWTGQQVSEALARATADPRPAAAVRASISAMEQIRAQEEGAGRREPDEEWAPAADAGQQALPGVSASLRPGGGQG